MARAKELLDLVKSPTAVATGVLLAFSRAQLQRNSERLDRAMTRWAAFAAGGATLLAAGTVAIMTPLAFRITFVNRGGVETRLLVYLLTFAVGVGTTTYAVFITKKCYDDLV